MERPRITPVERLVRLSGGGSESEDGSIARRLPPRLRPDEYECSCGRVDGFAVDLEGRRPVERDYSPSWPDPISSCSLISVPSLPGV